MKLTKTLGRAMVMSLLCSFGYSASSQVFITEVADPTNSANSRYIELFNAGASTVDLTGWTIELYFNGSITPGVTNTLAGTIAPGGYFILAQDATTYQATFGSAPDQDGTVSSNGDDVYVLNDLTPSVVDAYGVVGVDGTDLCQDFEDGRAERVASVTMGSATWNEAEWNIWHDGNAGTATCTNVTATAQSAPADFDPRFWIGSGAPSCGIAVTSTSAVCDAINPGPGDTYTLSISYSGVDASTSVVNNGASGTVGGDDPAITPDGTILVSGISEADGYSVTFTAPCDNINVSGSAPFCDPLPALVINEINADPDAVNGDANGDGNVSTSQDEFVEIVNNDVVDVDISGYTLADGFSIRHTFDPGTVIPAGCAIVVFGGGTPSGGFGGALVVTSSTGSLSLNNGGDDVILATGGGTTVASVIGYTGGGSNQSITLDPDITGAAFVQHSTATGSGGALYSPGTLIDGSNFSGCTPPACGISFQTESAVCVTSAPGPGDTYDLSIPYVGVQAGVTVINNSGSGTVGGDDPATVPNGTIVISGIDEANAYDVALSAPCDAVSVSGAAPSCEVAYTLVINEIDYDQPGSDVAEFIEIKNVGPDAFSLLGVVVELVNGNSGGASIYNSYTLPDSTIAAGDYYVICKDGSLTPNCDQIEPGLSIQNGGPDAVGLRTPSNTLIDAVSYEGDAGAPYTEGSGVGLEDSGAGGNEDLGISRYPDGTDTDVNNSDFTPRCITPGMANIMQNSFCVCEPPTASISTSCPDDFNFNIVVDLTSLGSAASVDIFDDQFISFEPGATVGTYVLGPFANNTVVEVFITHDTEPICDISFPGITEDCTPVGPCLDNEVSLEVTTDDYPAEITWEIYVSGTSTVVCSGGPYFNNFTTYIEPCCLPDGDYDLLFADGFGDGLNPGGGFMLKDPNGEMILGAEGIVTPGGSTSTYGQSFSVPIGDVNLYNYFCNKRDYLPTDFVVSELDPAVSAEYGVGDNTDDGYQFWFFDPYSGYSRRIFKSHANPVPGAPPGPGAAAHLRFVNMVTLPVPSETLLNCRIRPRLNGVNGPFGPSCFVEVNPTLAACPTTTLVNDPSSPFFSCGVSKTFGGSDKVRAQPVAGANRYQFEFSNVSEGYLRRIASPTYARTLSWSTGPLQDGVTYEVRVRVSFDAGANYCDWGDPCDVTIMPAGPAVAGVRSIEISSAEAKLYPNPSNGQQVYISLTDLESDIQYVMVELYGANGQMIAVEQITVSNGTVLAPIAMANGLPAGLYLVRTLMGDKQQTNELLITK